jgi:AAA15 family ATPase/GTPase
MLLEFRVSNFRSIRQEQVLSLVADAKDDELADSNTQLTSSTSFPRVLRSSVIYGANASGKSNLLLAMGLMQAVVRSTQAGQPLPHQPFALEPASRTEPTVFEVTFLIEGIRHQYGFSLTTERIHEEWLLVYKTAKPQEWFSRRWNASADDYAWSIPKANLQGAKDSWKSATRKDGLFLTTAIQLNSDQLRPIWDWITGKWWFYSAAINVNFIAHTIEQLKSEEGKRAVLAFLNHADLGIEDLMLLKTKRVFPNLVFDAAKGEFTSSPSTEQEVVDPVFTHRGETGTAQFLLQDESQGTQRYFAFAGWVLTVLNLGATFVIDELENSLHPLLVQHMVKLFNSSVTNPKGAQLIFTTHNTTLLGKSLFRRDQVWFTEKGPDLQTSLYSLSEFKGVRKAESFEKRYLEGRYGAVPILGGLDA